MVTFNDATVTSQDYWAVVKLWHTLDGLYFWEFFTTLDYEWSVIRGSRPYRWTIWVYSCARVATLLALIDDLIVLNISGQTNCQLWLTFELIFSHLAVATASFLIVLRVIAVWNKNRVVNAIALTAWVANLSCLIYGIVPLRSVWSPTTNKCERPNSKISGLNWIVSLSTDTILFLIMLLALFRWRQRNKDGSAFSLGHLLWNQGLIWLFIATVAYTLPVVFISLNLNASFNLMFQNPALVTLTIAATRMYRSLTEFRSHGISVSPPPKSYLVASEVNRSRVSPSRMEVVVHMEREQYPASQADHHSSSITTDEQLSIGDCVESESVRAERRPKGMIETGWREDEEGEISRYNP
ncbi:hypothetical protein BC827DRAFT_1269363 [Russula dissimulans]|nr:hypothetical protein BC827DRAFT_1269363 [Russula dissimulans]